MLYEVITRSYWKIPLLNRGRSPVKSEDKEVDEIIKRCVLETETLVATYTNECLKLAEVDLDPTNNMIPGENHITLAWGRDYGDVTPVKGVVMGGVITSYSIHYTKLYEIKMPRASIRQWNRCSGSAKESARILPT